MQTEKHDKPLSSTKTSVLAIGSVILAFLASQHHLIHIGTLMLLSGAGGSSMHFMHEFPTMRRIMLLLSLLMVGITTYQLIKRRSKSVMRITGGLSIILTLGLIGWSVFQFGI